jgi:hypothetical protein
MERPAFTPLADGHEYCVVVTWPNGRKSRINNFCASRDAQGWIERESENWLRLRSEGGESLRANETAAGVSSGG